MRITNRYLANNSLYSIQQNLSKLARSQEQTATSKRILRPSDDPNVLGQFMAIKSTLSYNLQYDRNLDDALSYLNMNDAVMGTMGDVLIQAGELTTQAANDTYNPADRVAVAEQIDKIIDQVVDLSNATVGGKYIYGGMENSKPPFAREGDIITYHGDTNGVYREVLAGTPYAVDAPGITTGAEVVAVNDAAKSLAELPRVLQRPDNKENTGIINIQYKLLDNIEINIGDILDSDEFDQIADNVYINEIDDNYMVYIVDYGNDHVYTVELEINCKDLGGTADKNLISKGDFTFNLAKDSEGRPDHYIFEVKNGDFAGLKIELPYYMAEDISGEPGGIPGDDEWHDDPWGDDPWHDDPWHDDPWEDDPWYIADGPEYCFTFDNRLGVFGNSDLGHGVVYDPADPKDDVDRGVFDSLFTLRDKLNDNDTAGLQGSVAELQQKTDQLLQHRVQVGARTRHFESIKEQLQDQEVKLTESLDQIEGADVSRLSIEFSQQGLTYQASLAVGAQIMQTSLLDFLR